MNEPIKQESKKLPSLFEIELTDGCLILRSIEELNDALWGAWFGSIQKALREQKWAGKSIDGCLVDLTECPWADPLPLLSLGIALAEFEKAGGKVSVMLPPSSAGAGFEQRCRLLKFMAREGFLSLLARPNIVTLPLKSGPIPASMRTIKIGDLDLTDELIDIARDLPVPIAFERSTCLPATLLYIEHPVDPDDLTALNEIDAWVERELYEAIEPVVADMVPGWAQRGVRYRLLMVLRETLHNVAEHAYAKSGFAAVYVRYREGALGEAPANWLRLNKFIKRERDARKLPLMAAANEREAFPITRPGFFEVFMLDAGQGLCKTLGSSKEELQSSNLHKMMLDIFDRGRSRKGSIRPTQFGGLYLTRQLLEPFHDYLRARDEDSWWGTELPLKKTDKGSQAFGQFMADARGNEHSSKEVEGLAWTIRLSWLEKADIAGPTQPWQGLLHESDRDYRDALLAVLQEYRPQNKHLSHVSIVDHRFPALPWRNLSKPCSSTVGDLLILPRPDWMKNRIQEELIESINHNLFSDRGTVIVGDIPSDEAITYLAAIENSRRFVLPPLSIIGRIILITRDLKVCVLERDLDGCFQRSLKNVSSIKYIRNKSSADQSLNYSLINYFRMLRNHDGCRLWEIVQGQGGTYIEESVDWNDGIILEGYLDFPQTLTHPVCREIYTVTLQRLVGLFPRHDCELLPLDPLVGSLIVRFNAEQHPRHHPKGSVEQRLLVSIGSIQVSGFTEKSERIDLAPVFHFFRHPSGSGHGRYLLPWLAPQIQSTSLSMNSYQRVGHTPVIARDGWKAYRMPRFDKDGHSIYQQTPSDSYRAWQEPSRTPMKIGHWSYGGHHDLLSLNVMLAFDTELDRISMLLGGSLARYVYANLFRVFGLKQEQLNERGIALFRAVENDSYRNLLAKEISIENPLLVYPSHPVTDHIIDGFLGLILDSFLEQVRQKIIPILPIRRHRSGSGLQVSGLVVERLVQISGTKPPLVLFDDAVITGRTYNELKSLLRSMGFEVIYSLLLLDRQRLPSANHVNNGRNFCYWRLDVPAMGSKNNCPLCDARRRIRDLADGLSSKEHRDRIESWRESWRPQNPASTQWGDGGVRPIPLWLEKPERRFGIEPEPENPKKYRQIGGKNQQIRITNSAGLVAYVSELHSITSRDNLSIQMIANEALDPQTRIQLVASQLLLFAGEFDRSLALDLGQLLLNALWDAERHDRHTALASLTLVACGDDFLTETVRIFLTEERFETAKNRNMDLILLFALASHVDRIVSNRTARAAKLAKLEQLEAVSRLLNPLDKIDVYRRFHREVKDTLGKCHSSPLHRLKRAAEDPEVLTDQSIRSALGSVDQLQALVDGIQRYSLRTGSEGHQDYVKIRDELSKTAISLYLALKNLEDQRKIEKATTKDIDIVRDLAEALLQQADKFHASLFFPLGINDMKKDEDRKECSLLQELRKLLPNWKMPDGETKNIHWHASTPYESKMHSKNLTISKLELTEAFVVWDSDVIDALRDVLTNVRHSKGASFTDPWCKSGLTDKADMWGRLELDEHAARIELCNRSSRTAKEIIELTENSYSHGIFRNIGGSINYSESDEKLRTTILLPYAHTLFLSQGGR